MAKKKPSKLKDSPEKVEHVSQEEAQVMVENGEAEIPAEAIINECQESDLAKHPKFAKFNSHGGNK